MLSVATGTIMTQYFLFHFKIIVMNYRIRYSYSYLWTSYTYKMKNCGSYNYIYLHDSVNYLVIIMGHLYTYAARWTCQVCHVYTTI